MQDKIETFGTGSVIHHGKLNNRVYLIKLLKADFPDIIEYINNLAKENRYTKIFCKVPCWAAPVFSADGFVDEAYVPDFYNGEEAAFFMSKYLNSDRLLNIEYEKLKELSKLLASFSQNGTSFKLENGYKIQKLNSENASEMSGIYQKVFKSYPFPIHNPEYIAETMRSGVQYFGIENEGQLVALSSAEVDEKASNAEMTDFATLPGYRGKKLSVLLLKEMEEVMRNQGIKTLYTIARLNSIPMNKTFLNLGYKYSGTLINNTNIAGEIESMNVYFKHV